MRYYCKTCDCLYETEHLDRHIIIDLLLDYGLILTLPQAKMKWAIDLELDAPRNIVLHMGRHQTPVLDCLYGLIVFEDNNALDPAIDVYDLSDLYREAVSVANTYVST